MSTKMITMSYDEYEEEKEKAYNEALHDALDDFSGYIINYNEYPEGTPIYCAHMWRALSLAGYDKKFVYGGSPIEEGCTCDE